MGKRVRRSLTKYNPWNLEFEIERYETEFSARCTYVSTSSAVMPPVGESKWRRTAHAHCNTVIRNPHRGFLSEFHDLFVPLLHSLHNNENIKRIQIVKIIRRGLQNLVNVNGKMEKRPLFKKILKPTKNGWDSEGVWVTSGVNESDWEVSTRRRNPKFGIFRVTSSEREKGGGGVVGGGNWAASTGKLLRVGKFNWEMGTIQEVYSNKDRKWIAMSNEIV